MKLIKLYHTGGYQMTKEELLNKLNDSAPLKPEILKAKNKEFLVLQGNTRIAGYLLVIQALTKKYKPLDVIAVAENLSVYGI